MVVDDYQVNLTAGFNYNFRIFSTIALGTLKVIQGGESFSALADGLQRALRALWKGTS